MTNDLIFTITIKISNASQAAGDKAVEDMIKNLEQFEASGMEVTINDLRPAFNATKEGDKLLSKPEDDPVTYMDIDGIFED